MRNPPLSLSQARNKLTKSISSLKIPDKDLLVTIMLESGEFSILDETDNRELLHGALFGKKTYYAIHNTDLKLIDACVGVVGAIPSIQENPIPVISALLLLLYRYHKKKAKLNAHQGAILLLLKQAAPNGLAISGIQKRYNKLLSTTTKQQMKFNVSRIKDELQDLKNMRLVDGTTTSFVSVHKGKWIAVDV